MILLRKPSIDTLRAFLASQSGLDFTYAAVGATATTPPAGYVVDHTRIQLGTGEPTFRAAIAAMQRWEHFNLGWVQASPADDSIRSGNLVAVMARFAGVWWLNACRVVYRVDDAGPVMKFGFAYGTLPAHAESGEERFQIEWNQQDNTVWYDILAFSKPNEILVRLAYRWQRRLQKRFALESCAAMVRCVKTPRG